MTRKTFLSDLHEHTLAVSFALAAQEAGTMADELAALESMSGEQPEVPLQMGSVVSLGEPTAADKRALAEASAHDPAIEIEVADMQMQAESYLLYPSDELDGFDLSITMLQSRLIVDGLKNSPSMEHLRNIERMYRELEAENDTLRQQVDALTRERDELLIGRRVKTTIPMGNVIWWELATQDGKEFTPTPPGLEGVITRYYGHYGKRLIVEFDDGVWADYEPEKFAFI